MDRNSNEAWILESYGPDRNPSRPSAGGASPTSPNPDSFLTLYETVGRGRTATFFLVGDVSRNYTGSYDPTNGTVSRGDIVRMSYAQK